MLTAQAKSRQGCLTRPHCVGSPSPGRRHGEHKASPCRLPPRTRPQARPHAAVSTLLQSRRHAASTAAHRPPAPALAPLAPLAPCPAVTRRRPPAEHPPQPPSCPRTRQSTSYMPAADPTARHRLLCDQTRLISLLFPEFLPSGPLQTAPPLLHVSLLLRARNNVAQSRAGKKKPRPYLGQAPLRHLLLLPNLPSLALQHGSEMPRTCSAPRTSRGQLPQQTTTR